MSIFDERFQKAQREKEKRSFKIAAFDTETPGEHWGQTAVFCTYCHEDDMEVKEFTDLADFVKVVLDPSNRKQMASTVIYAHNAGFDLRFIVPLLTKYRDEIVVEPRERMTNNIYELVITDKTTGKRITRFRDSMALYPKKLEEFSSLFAPQYKKQNIKKEDGTFRFDVNNPVHREYARNDALCLVVSLKAFDDLVYEKYGIHIKGTISSTAFQAMLRFLPDDETYWRHCRTAEQWLRKGYYGGRVQANDFVIFRSSDPKVTTYTYSFDINSSYPAQMRKGVPKGKGVFTSQYEHGFPGIYDAVVTVPDIPFPPIPRKDKDGTLSFPIGTFNTRVTSMELERLIELGGYFKVIEGFYFPEGLCFPFGDFVYVCEKLRTEFKRTATEEVVKLIQNSVYGKFGTRPEGRRVSIDLTDSPTGNLVFDNDGDPIPYLRFEDEVRDANYMMPHWAAWITANARLAIDHIIETAGRDNAKYTDTDSVKCNLEGYDNVMSSGIVGSAYGQVKEEAIVKDFVVHGPKMYSGYVQDNEGKWDPHIKIKAIPHKDAIAHFDMIRDGGLEPIEFDRPTSLMTFLKTGKLARNIKRKPTDPNNVMGHRIINGRWAPIVLHEAEGAF